jgi:predicted PurR-regulated permease PerM
MQRDLRTLLFFALLAAVVWCSWLVLKPFLPGIIWASVLVCTFTPLHERLSARLRGRAWLASTIVTVVVAAFIVVPTIVAAVQVVQGSIDAYGWVQTAYNDNGLDLGANERWPRLEETLNRGKDLIGLADVDVKATGIDFVKKLGAFAATQAPGLVGGALGLGFSFIVMLVMMFTLFAKGRAAVDIIASALPLPRESADRIMRDLGLMTRSVFISVGLTALVQAGLGAFALLVLGVPKAFTLGAAMFFFAILPGGPAIVWIPVAIWLAANGHPWKAILLAAWGAGVIGTIDNVLRPYFAKEGVKLPGMLLFLGLLGGLFAFGVVGLFAGPIVLYLLRELTSAMAEEA